MNPARTPRFASVAAMPEAREFRAALMAGDETKAAALAKGWQYAGILHAEMCFHVVDALQIAGGEVITTPVDLEPQRTAS